tara:strand:+ start:505 stop:714 length:210 start_codon:yes stop_codon:yes gene_type:complete
MGPLPLVLLASVLPTLLWRHNLDLGVAYKLAAETPTVWLILLQCTLRAVVLTQVLLLPPSPVGWFCPSL